MPDSSPAFSVSAVSHANARELSSLTKPLRFSHRLSGCDALTYITLTACYDAERLCFYVACFEKNPTPDHRFSFCFGQGDEMLQLSFSCSEASLPDSAITLSRDGGENLEGIFWGAELSVPLMLLPDTNAIPCKISYYYNDTVSSVFPNGTGALQLC